MGLFSRWQLSRGRTSDQAELITFKKANLQCLLKSHLHDYLDEQHSFAPSSKLPENSISASLKTMKKPQIIGAFS